MDTSHKKLFLFLDLFFLNKKMTRRNNCSNYGLFQTSNEYFLK